LDLGTISSVKFRQQSLISKYIRYEANTFDVLWMYIPHGLSH
jgi:hypothetical protein